eukprot:3445273-Amphidinium_carterae.1
MKTRLLAKCVTKSPKKGTKKTCLKRQAQRCSARMTWTQQGTTVWLIGAGSTSKCCIQLGTVPILMQPYFWQKRQLGTYIKYDQAVSPNHLFKCGAIPSLMHHPVCGKSGHTETRRTKTDHNTILHLWEIKRNLKGAWKKRLGERLQIYQYHNKICRNNFSYIVP